MIVSMSSLTYDLNGHVEIRANPGNTTGQTRRRVSRVATLDGGVSVSDFGFAEGDRTLQFTWKNVSQAHSALVDRLVQTYTRLRVCVSDAVYIVAPESFTPGAGQSSISLLVIEKESQ